MTKLPSDGETNQGCDPSLSSQPAHGAIDKGGCKMGESILISIGFEDKICTPAKRAYLESVINEVDQFLLLSLASGDAEGNHG